MTPYYQDDWVTIYHGDAHALASDLEACRLITDPPYGTAAYETDELPDDLLMKELITESDTAAVFGYPEMLVRLCAGRGIVPTEWVTWWPTNKPSARTAGLARESEHVAIFGETWAERIVRPRSQDIMTRRIAESRGNDINVCRMGDVWRDPSPGAGFNRHLRLHVNEKPVALMCRLVKLCSQPGDIILDPFCGSGTTLRAAKDLGRRAIGIEIEERYCEIAANRCAQEVLNLA